MKFYCKLLFVAAVALSSCACGDKVDPLKDHALLIYIAGNNSLSSYAISNVEDLLAHARIPKNESLLAYVDRRGAECVLWELRFHPKTGAMIIDTLRNYGKINSAQPETLAQVIDDARSLRPARTYGLLLWSHGTGWLPKGEFTDLWLLRSAGEPQMPAWNDPIYPKTRTFAVDGNVEMEMDQLASVLNLRPHEYIIFDACLMGSIELLYELKDAAHYFVASPTEILESGLPYHQMTQALFPYQGEESLRQLCQWYYEEYQAMSGDYQSATIALVHASGLDYLAQTFQQVVANGRPYTEVNRNEIQVYDRLNQHIFFDLDHFAQALGTPQDYARFQEALLLTVMRKWATQKFITLPITHYSGLSAYIPSVERPASRAAFARCGWNRAVGLLPVGSLTE